jgi:hypothetical protein
MFEARRGWSLIVVRAKRFDFRLRLVQVGGAFRLDFRSVLALLIRLLLGLLCASR